MNDGRRRTPPPSPRSSGARRRAPSPCTSCRSLGCQARKSAGGGDEVRDVGGDAVTSREASRGGRWGSPDHPHRRPTVRMSPAPPHQQRRDRQRAGTPTGRRASSVLRSVAQRRVVLPREGRPSARRLCSARLRATDPTSGSTTCWQRVVDRAERVTLTHVALMRSCPAVDPGPIPSASAATRSDADPTGTTLMPPIE